MRGFFGTHWKAEADGRRSWRCPRCRFSGDGDQWRLRRTFTLLDHPLLSRTEEDRFLICGGCRRTFSSAVLDAPAPPHHLALSEDERAILGVTAAVIFSDSSVRAVEKRAARAVIRRFTGQELDSIDLKQVLRTARRQWRDPVAQLRRLASLLDAGAKRRIIAAAYLVSGSDREIHREESRLLMQLGEALDLPPREVRAAMREASREAI